MPREKSRSIYRIFRQVTVWCGPAFQVTFFLSNQRRAFFRKKRFFQNWREKSRATKFYPHQTLEWNLDVVAWVKMKVYRPLSKFQVDNSVSCTARKPRTPTVKLPISKSAHCYENQIKLIVNLANFHFFKVSILHEVLSWSRKKVSESSNLHEKNSCILHEIVHNWLVFRMKSFLKV